MTYLEKLVELTIGSKKAVELALRIPFVPKHLFLSTKIRYFNRHSKKDEATKYIESITKKPSIECALKLHTIMGGYGCIDNNNEQIKRNVTALKAILLSFKPKNEKQAFRQVRTLIKCFDLKNAKQKLEENRHLISKPETFTLYFKVIKEKLNVDWDILESAWTNTLESSAESNENKKSLIFYFPPSITALEMGECSNDDRIFLYISVFFSNLFATIPLNRYDVIPKLQFEWRAIHESGAHDCIVSYHTKGEEKNNLRVKESAFSRYFNLDPLGYSGWHSAAKLDEKSLLDITSNIPNIEIEEIFSRLNREFVLNNESKYNQKKICVESPTLKDGYIFLCLQVVNDVVSTLAYIDVYTLLKDTVELARKHDLNLVIKRHPRCRSARIENLLKRLTKTNKIHITNASIHELIPAAKIVLTVNSGVGMEALLHAKRVVISGKTDYSCAVKTVTTKHELETELLSGEVANVDTIKRFIYHYYTKHLFRFDDTAKIDSFWKQYH